MKKLLLLLSIFFAFSALAQPPAYVPTDSLVGWWPFSGNVNDESGNGNNGLVADSWPTTDRFGNANSAYFFDGLMGFISINTSSILAQNTRTYSLWVNINSNLITEYQHLITSADPCGCDYLSINGNHPTYIANGTFGRFYCGKSGADGTFAIHDDVWHHIVLIHDYAAQTAYLYIDNVLDNTVVSANFSVQTPLVNFMIGNGSGPQQGVHGDIDDIGIWNRALTECEIQDLYDAQVNGTSIDAGADVSLCAGDQTTLTAAAESGIAYTMDVTATSSTDYTFSGDFSGLDPDITAEVGDTLIFNVNATSHPFWIKTAPITGTGNAVIVANNGTGSGIISWVPTAPGTYYYICQFHSGMWATITINASSTTVAWNNGVSDGVPFTPTVEGYYVATATNGSCVVSDSLYLSIGQPTSSSITQTRCDSFNAPDGTTYTTSGIYTAIIPNLAGCDSTITIDLTILNSTVSSIVVTKCNTYAAPDGVVYTSSGSYMAIIVNAAGCDSIIVIDLTINYGTNSSTTLSRCDAYTAPDGNVYTTSGIYTAIIPNATNCDSTIIINLTINYSSTGSITETACGTYIAPDGASYSTTGIYTAILPNAAGCDSTITIDLTVNAGTTGATTETVCDSYIAPDGAVYTTSGIYTAVLPNASGCDSTITIDLTVNATASSITPTACGSYTAPDGAVYTTTGIYTAILTNAAGCDSTITIDLTVGNASNGTATPTACDSYTAPDGAVYTSSGIYTAVIPNALGCDSTISIGLTLNSSSTGSTTETVCDSYTAPDGAVYTSTGIYTAVIPNAANCDSTITIDLTLNSSSTGSTTETVCDSYTAPDGNVYTSTGIYTAVLSNAASCDSTITIDLTVNNSSVSSVTEAACDSYTAPDGAVYTSTGIYTAIIPNAANCDSTITIDLTVNNATASSISETALDSYIAPSGAVYTTSSVFNDTILNAAGCDSIITIDLTMNFTGLEELNDQQVLLTPNPTSDFITIEGIENVTGITSMELVSSVGRVVAELKVGTEKIDVSTLSSGTYFLSITHANGTERLRFVKE